MKEFQEIGHCGGQYIIRVSTNAEGHQEAHFGWRQSRPTAASMFTIYALSQGIPVATMDTAGIGRPWKDPPTPDCIPVFIASDVHGKFGHRCQGCRGYWRSTTVPSRWNLTCPYCGRKSATHELLTVGQLRYVVECCRLASEAINSGDGEYVVDMDAVADAAGRETPKPKLYHAEESQQNKFTCEACGEFNDILGRFGYCSNCGSYNSSAELEREIATIQRRIGDTTEFESCAKDAVSAFDSCARQIAKQLGRRVPMTPRRREHWKRKLFHGLAPAIQELRDNFDIDITKGMTSDDVAFTTRMFYRRHVYEHNGGEVDERYISESGDTTVRPKQTIRESRDSATRLTRTVTILGRNMTEGFHTIFPPEDKPIRYHAEWKSQRSRSKR